MKRVKRLRSYTSRGAQASEQLSILDTVDYRDVEFLEDRLAEHNMSYTGITDGRLLVILVRDAENDIVAGLYGWTWGGTCEIRSLWVHEQRRGRDLGTRLMTAAETEVRARGAVQMVLTTHSFQAPDFYRRLGFETVGAIDEYPAGHQLIFMRKRLV